MQKCQAINMMFHSQEIFLCTQGQSVAKPEVFCSDSVFMYTTRIKGLTHVHVLKSQ